MNPAEEIVKFSLQQQGYFFESSIKVGRKDIDILAVHPIHPNQRRHIEVSVSINMVDPKNTPESKALHYLNHHFGHPEIKPEVQKRFGQNLSYKMELVVGDIRLKGRECLAEFTRECKKLDITVITFASILEKIRSNLGTGTEFNGTIKTVQLCKKFMPRSETKI